MVANDQARYQLHQRLDGVLGAEQTSTLMSHLPPSGWADVATRQDLDHLAVRMDARIDRVEQRLDSKIDRLDAKIGGLEERLDTKIDGVEERLVLRLDSAKNELLAAFRGELTTAVTSQTRSLMFAMAGLLFTATSVGYTAARLS